MQTRTIQYQDQETVLKGFYAVKEGKMKPRPAVIVTHDWTGRNEFACEKAQLLAQLGYVGFAIDMYGDAKLGKTVDEKTQLIQPFLQRRQKLQQRIQAGFNCLLQQPEVDKNKIAAIGFCFGGLCVLDLARMGTGILGVVSFHGLFNAPDNIKQPKIKAKILALHGHDDPMVPPAQVLAFETEMTAAKADWQIHVYGNTKHAFTNPEAHDEKLGTVFDAIAAKRSWQALENFLQEIFH